MGISKEDYILEKYNVKQDANKNHYEEKINEIVLLLMQARKEKNMTQLELAKKIGTCKNTISRMETLTVYPSFDTLLKIADALDFEFILVPRK